MNQVKEQKKPLDLATRTFAKPAFIIPWMLFLVIVFRLVGWPVRNFALVCWVYGSKAYYQGGVRILPGKPVKFSDGVAVPLMPDVITGFGAFITTFLVPTITLIVFLKFYQRHSER
jgi:hypothetical protein